MNRSTSSPPSQRINATVTPPPSVGPYRLLVRETVDPAAETYTVQVAPEFSHLVSSAT